MSHREKTFVVGAKLLFVQGIVIQSSYLGVHTVGEIRPHSPAFMCRRLEECDEILQVNYQTVVGWLNSKVRDAVEDGQPTQTTSTASGGVEVVLTLRKAPRHIPSAISAASNGPLPWQIRSPPPPAGSFNLDARYGAHLLSTSSRYNYRTEPRRRQRKDDAATTNSVGATNRRK